MKRGAGYYWGVAGLGLVAVGLTAYLSVEYLEGSAPSCGIASGCAQVTTSEYATLLGIPVAVLGMAMYSVLVMGAVAVLAQGETRLLRRGLLALAGFGVAFTVYLVVVQIVAIGALCIYCLGSAGLITAIFVVLLAKALVEWRGSATRHSDSARLLEGVGGRSGERAGT